MKGIRTLNLLSLLAAILVSALANILPINHVHTGEIWDSFQAMIAPEKFVFVIWIVIYLTLLVFSIFQIMPAQKNNERLNRVGIWFILANVFNSGWIFAWHFYQFGLSLILMVGLLISLIVIYQRLKIGSGKMNPNERWLVDLPFSLYLGWTSVTIVMNSAALLLDQNWSGFGISESGWTVAAIILLIILGVIIAIKKSEVFYPLVIIWAFIGIAVNGNGNTIVTMSAWVGAALLMIIIVIARGFLRRKQLIDRYKR